ncbi:hypothetical protein PanWU01x14_076510, partial [Parasponia andersonii]
MICYWIQKLWKSAFTLQTHVLFPPLSKQVHRYTIEFLAFEPRLGNPRLFWSIRSFDLVICQGRILQINGGSKCPNLLRRAISEMRLLRSQSLQLQNPKSR